MSSLTLSLTTSNSSSSEEILWLLFIVLFFLKLPQSQTSTGQAWPALTCALARPNYSETLGGRFLGPLLAVRAFNRQPRWRCLNIPLNHVQTPKPLCGVYMLSHWEQWPSGASDCCLVPAPEPHGGAQHLYTYSPGGRPAKWKVIGKKNQQPTTRKQKMRTFIKSCRAASVFTLKWSHLFPSTDAG